MTLSTYNFVYHTFSIIYYYIYEKIIILSVLNSTSNPTINVKIFGILSLYVLVTNCLWLATVDVDKNRSKCYFQVCEH